MDGATWLYVLLTLLSRVTSTGQNSRLKREILPDKPRIITENGHLIFQSGLNRNITFRSGSGGVYLDNLDLKYAVTQTQANKQSIDRIQSSLGSAHGSRDVSSRLNTLETQAQPLLNLPDRVSSMSASMHGLQSQIAALEESFRNLQTLLTTNECLSNPCQNGGTCMDMYNGYFCRCPSNWQGSSCTEDVNECATYAGTDLGCLNGATCLNSHGSFSCQCATDWFGVHCSERHNDCTGASHAELCGHGTCINEKRTVQGQAKYLCICENGWTASNHGPACTGDINECTSGAHCSLDPPVQCINIPGSFVCGSCPAGYTGNGHRCSDINECEVNNGGCSISPRVECSNTRGSRACGLCPPGYQGNGVTCTYVGLCSINNGGCHHLATCSDDTGGSGAICTCPDGYAGSGVGLNGCLEQSHTGACIFNPCQNEAVCTPQGSTGFVCACHPGHSGSTCNIVVDVCASNPCKNGGTCTSESAEFTSEESAEFSCQCTNDFTGNTCEQSRQACGDHLSNQAGSFRYHETTDFHPVNCAWTIETDYDKILTLTFSSFFLETHDECYSDFLQIHDGRSSSSYMIGKYCRSEASNRVTLNSTQNYLYFWFFWEDLSHNDGFEVQWTSHLPACGEHLKGSDHGDISSPGYPGNYPHDSNCVWTVAVTPGNNIHLLFSSMALEAHTNCSYDFLEIRDGQTDIASLIGRFCGNGKTPLSIETTGPYVYLRFHSDEYQSDKGFHITYSVRAGCGDLLSKPNGNLVSPGYQNPNRHCVWVVSVALRNHILLSFTHFSLDTSSCVTDYLTVRDGYDQTAPLLGTYCTDNLPADITSSSNIMNIELHTDISNMAFTAHWSTVCEGTFSGSEGQIHSPDLPQDLQCNYRIEVPDHYIIRLHFTDFGLETEVYCNTNYIEIYDGPNAAAPRIGSRLCGFVVTNEIMSTGSDMFIRFVRDESTFNHGFRATFYAVEEGCGSVLNHNTGSISSSNEYIYGINCTWYINVSPGLVIRLYLSVFYFAGTSCASDFVGLYDGSTMNEESRMSWFCGPDTPEFVTSTSNALVVNLQFNHDKFRIGFYATYTSINASRCGSELTSTTGVVTSPNYPNHYQDRQLCEWTITVAGGNQILVNISDIDITEDTNCKSAYLEIRNGGYVSSPLIQILCRQHSVTEPILSHSNTLFIRFKSDGLGTSRGFRLEYTGATSGCGGDLTTPSGFIVSPHYPHPYAHRSICYWTITVSHGSTIMLNFLDLDVDDQFGCYYNHLEVREGGPENRFLGKYCGSVNPFTITTTTNKILLTYKTYLLTYHRGFMLQYLANCSGHLTGNRGVIESPNFPNQYLDHSNCTWTIEVPAGNTIRVLFVSFRLEDGCYSDYLKINDGGDVNATELRTICGSDLPDQLQSTGNLLWLNFVSNPNTTYDGFRLEWKVVGCGDYLYGSSGTIKSPTFTNPHYHECQWVITVETGKSIEFTILSIDMENSSNCSNDVLEIYAGRDRQGPRLFQQCSKHTQSQTIHTSGTTAFVYFRINFYRSGLGFSLTYRAVSGGCGGNYTAKNARITSANYPNYDIHAMECEWNITVAKGHVVVLNFTGFELKSGDFMSCSDSYVNLYDGPGVTSTLIANLCGTTSLSPAIYKSNGNQMFVRMIFNVGNIEKRFSATYTTVCGGTLNADIDGEIVSPDYPNQYNWNTQCIWIISSAFNDRRVSLTFTHMDINSNCAMEYVTVNDGREPIINQTLDQQNEFCGTFVPETITSEGSALSVVFQSYMHTFKSGFRAVYSSEYASCNGEFTAQSGRFISPSYPDGYPVNIECVWLIKASPGNRIQLSFPHFELDPLGGINDDYVEIRSPNVSARGVRWIGNNSPTNLTSLFGAWIKFRSNEDTTAPGFVAEYSSLYGGELIGDSGQIASPGYPAFYPSEITATWTILVTQDTRIRLWFSAFSLEDPNSEGACTNDFVQVSDGIEESSVLLQKFCGKTIPSPFYSKTNQVSVVFSSDQLQDESGFLLNWQAVKKSRSGCGVYLEATDTQQNITSPGYPDNYANNLNCYWTINAPEGYTVIVNITSINLEGAHRCENDFLTLYDYSGLEKEIFCGQRGVGVIKQSTSNYLFVKFITDSFETRQGFVLTYTKGCGGTMYSPTGVIQSLHYPNNYPANQNCTWKVAVQTHSTIRLAFQDHFNIADSGQCNNDFLMLLNGYTNQSPALYLNGTTNTNGHYCGSSKPQSLNTSSNHLFVNFVSDESNQAAGFSFTYSSVSVDTCTSQLKLTNTVTSGYINSPNYPGNYPQNIDCTWTIIAPVTRRIQVDFEGTFYIEYHNDCGWDYVEFFDGGTINSQRLGSRLCGSTLPGTVLSTGNVLLARFRADFVYSHEGFRAKFSIASCGGRITANTGVITSPNYPGNYDNNLDCVWIIACLNTHFLVFNITYFSVQDTVNCTADYLILRDGNATDTILFQKCGRSEFLSFETSDSTAYLWFKSDTSITSEGFSITYQASSEECGGQMNTPTGIITSPKYPDQYYHSRKCVWDITVPLGRRVTLTFTDMRMELNFPWYCYYYRNVEVFNGILWPQSLQNLCGYNITKPIESSSNTMRVQYRNYDYAMSSSFRAIYTSDREAVCGGYLTESPGNITDPDNSKVRCLWHFHNRLENSSIRLYFTNLSMEQNSHCDHNYIQIIEGSYPTSPVFDKICDTNSVNRPFVTPETDITILFMTDRHESFQLTYQFTECGGVLISPQGVIASPNYPSNYSHVTVGCAWKIVAPAGTRIRVNFIDFFFETGPECTLDNLDIQNGGLPDSPSIGKYCGTSWPSSFVSQSNELRLTMTSNLTSTVRRFKLEYSFDSGGCGGLYHSNQGSLSTPNYPSSYPHNVECQWDINVQAGNIINLRFNPPFDLEARNCINDYVEVFDVLTNNSTFISLGRWCHNIEPPAQKSSSNRMLVVFQSDASTNGNGFSASWHAECGGLFTSPQGLLFSPGYPNSYFNNLSCTYMISSASQSQISLHFTDFELEDSYNCRSDSVQVWQATDDQFFEYVHRLCGSISGRTVKARGQMKVQFTTNESGQFKGFRAEYFSEECGGIFTNPSGTISSPIYHGWNFMNLNCTWNITVAANRVIRFKFQLLNIHPYLKCSSGYVSFHDGANYSSDLTARYCGGIKDVPEYVTSRGNQIYINLVAKIWGSSPEFKGSYWTTYGPNQGCGGLLRQSSGTLSWVNRDSEETFEGDLHCKWLIVVNDRKIVTLTVNGLDLGTSQGCTDSLKIYDGFTKDHQELGSYCGETAPGPPMIASSNEVFVVYIMTASRPWAGFNASFTETDALCRGVFNASSTPTTIASPNYPNSAGTAIRCSWIIDSGDSNKQVRLTVMDLQLQASSRCENEYLTFSDRPMGSTGQKLIFCGSTIPHPFDSKGMQVQISFFLATTSLSRGFQLTYQIADCNRNVTIPNGRITSPGFPDMHAQNSDCTTQITSPENTTLSLYFKKINIEEHRHCTYNYLEIKNSTSTTVAKLCGRVIPSPIFMMNNMATLKFVSDISWKDSGYDVTFLSSSHGPGCGGNLTGLLAGTFTSPGYPLIFQKSATCSWYVTPPVQRSLYWRISFLNTPGGNGTCDNNYLSIYDGSTTTGPLVKHFCSFQESASIAIMTEQPLLVYYVSSANGSAPVFRFQFDVNN